MGAILLVGCGNIGFRHLQAICDVPAATDIVVVEPAVEHHARIESQFVAGAAPGRRFELHTRLPTDPAEFDVGVVATTAEPRREIVEEIFDHHRLGAIVLEKVVAQTRSDLEVIGARIDHAGAVGFVNCGRRTFDGYRKIAAEIAPETEVTVTVRGNEFGLASNAIHFVDLAEFLSGTPTDAVDARGLERAAAPGKRPGTVELYGRITGRLARGGSFSIESGHGAATEIEVTIETPTTTWVVDEIGRVVTAEGSGPEPFASQNVSESDEVYRDLLDHLDCSLTPYGDSRRQHELVIDAVRDHLGISIERDDPCPIS